MHWLISAFLVIIFASGIHIFSKFQAGNIASEVAVFYCGIAFFAVCTGYFVFSGQSLQSAISLPTQTIVIALVIGAFWALAQIFVILMYNSNAPLTVALPFVRSGAVVLGVMVGVLFFKEQLSMMKLAGIVMGIAALFLMVRG